MGDPDQRADTPASESPSSRASGLLSRPSREARVATLALVVGLVLFFPLLTLRLQALGVQDPAPFSGRLSPYRLDPSPAPERCASDACIVPAPMVAGVLPRPAREVQAQLLLHAHAAYGAPPDPLRFSFEVGALAPPEPALHQWIQVSFGDAPPIPYRIVEMSITNGTEIDLGASTPMAQAAQKAFAGLTDGRAVPHSRRLPLRVGFMATSRTGPGVAIGNEALAMDAEGARVWMLLAGRAMPIQVDVVPGESGSFVSERPGALGLPIRPGDWRLMPSQARQAAHRAAQPAPMAHAHRLLLPGATLIPATQAARLAPGQPAEAR